MNVAIKVATPDDAVLIADLSRQTFYDTFAPQNSKEDMEIFLAEQFTTEALIKEVGAAGNTFLLAYVENALAGYVRLRTGEAPQSLGTKNAIEIARLYATKDMMGKGVGKALMQASINAAIENEKEIIWLGVWDMNLRAISFYHQWGFQKFDEHDFMLGRDKQRDWLMKKQL